MTARTHSAAPKDGKMKGWMRRVVPFLLALGVILGTHVGAHAQSTGSAPPEIKVGGSQPVTIQGLEITAEDEGTRIRLEATGSPEYRVSASDDPPTIELDLFDVIFRGLPPRAEVGDGTIESVETTSLPGGAGRVVLKLTVPGEATVTQREGGLDLIVRPKAAQEPVAESTVAATSVRSIDGGGIAFDLGKPPRNLSAFVLSDGRRLVVDAEDVEISEPQILRDFQTGPIARVRMGRQEGRVRSVVEARDPAAFENYRLEKRETGFALILGQATRVATAQGRPELDVATASLPGGGRVTDLGFRQEPDRSLVEISFSRPAPHEVREATGERLVVDLLKTSVPEAFRRALDTSAFPGPVRVVAAYPRGEDTRVVVSLRDPAPFRVIRDGERLTLAFEGGSEAPAPGRVAGVQPGETEVVVIEGQPGAEPPAPMVKGEIPPPIVPAEPVYTGRRLSMDFVNADIRNVLRLIGEVSGLNVVAGDDVSGKVTVRLVDVPWDQALEVILKTRGLDKVTEGNVIRIAPAERLAQEKARALEEAKAAEELEPLVTDIIPVNYASAQELSDKVTSILSERGSVSVDQRTNSMIVKDVVEKVEEARELVARLDTQTPQVLIEARIVEVASTFERDLGVQWGGQFSADTAHGNSTGWAFPNSVNLQGDTGADNFAVNFPSFGGLGGGPGGALLLNLGHINDVLSLDLRLSAIEISGRGRLISSPRVTTLDNKTAEISQGIEIPFTTATEEKIETQSIDYLLTLNVTPHVTADRSIIMQIQVTKDAPDPVFRAVDSQTPAKDTKSATTELLVKDGATTVIGGIITDQRTENESKIPWLGNIPGLGWLFKAKNKAVDKTELIIFITPKIVDSEQVARGI